MTTHAKLILNGKPIEVWKKEGYLDTDRPVTESELVKILQLLKQAAFATPTHRYYIGTPLRKPNLSDPEQAALAALEPEDGRFSGTEVES